MAESRMADSPTNLFPTSCAESEWQTVEQLTKAAHSMRTMARMEMLPRVKAIYDKWADEHFEYLETHYGITEDVNK